MKNRYEEIKRIYKNYIILIKSKNKYRTFDMDHEILRFIKYKNKVDLKMKHLNYLVLDNLDIDEIYENDDNSYDVYFLKTGICKILEICGGLKL